MKNLIITLVIDLTTWTLVTIKHREFSWSHF